MRRPSLLLVEIKTPLPSFSPLVPLAHFHLNRIFMSWFRYARFVLWPQCLTFLDLLQDETFRNKLESDEVIAHIHDEQVRHFRTARNAFEPKPE
jgi:hypothetical protein